MLLDAAVIFIRINWSGFGVDSLITGDVAMLSVGEVEKIQNRPGFGGTKPFQVIPTNFHGLCCCSKLHDSETSVDV